MLGETCALCTTGSPDDCWPRKVCACGPPVTFAPPNMVDCCPDCGASRVPPVEFGDRVVEFEVDCGGLERSIPGEGCWVVCADGVSLMLLGGIAPRAGTGWGKSSRFTLKAFGPQITANEPRIADKVCCGVSLQGPVPSTKLVP